MYSQDTSKLRPSKYVHSKTLPNLVLSLQPVCRPAPVLSFVLPFPQELVPAVQAHGGLLCSSVLDQECSSPMGQSMQQPVTQGMGKWEQSCPALYPTTSLVAHCWDRRTLNPPPYQEDIASELLFCNLYLPLWSRGNVTSRPFIHVDVPVLVPEG